MPPMLQCNSWRSPRIRIRKHRRKETHLSLLETATGALLDNDPTGRSNPKTYQTDACFTLQMGTSVEVSNHWPIEKPSSLLRTPRKQSFSEFVGFRQSVATNRVSVVGCERSLLTRFGLFRGSNFCHDFSKSCQMVWCVLQRDSHPRFVSRLC